MNVVLPLLAQAAQDFAAAVQRAAHRGLLADTLLMHFVHSKHVGAILLHNEAWVGLPCRHLLVHTVLAQQYSL
jgi:hypothetical protein